LGWFCYNYQPKR